MVVVKYICDLRHWSQLVSIEEDCNLSRLGAPPDSHQSSRIGQRLSDLTARERGERRERESPGEWDGVWQETLLLPLHFPVLLSARALTTVMTWLACAPRVVEWSGVSPPRHQSLTSSLHEPIKRDQFTNWSDYYPPLSTHTSRVGLDCFPIEHRTGPLLGWEVAQCHVGEWKLKIPLNCFYSSKLSREQTSSRLLQAGVSLFYLVKFIKTSPLNIGRGRSNTGSSYPS